MEFCIAVIATCGAVGIVSIICDTIKEINETNKK